jgi:hypothetical protein
MIAGLFGPFKVGVDLGSASAQDLDRSLLVDAAGAQAGRTALQNLARAATETLQ